MDATYIQWIRKHVDGDGYGACREVTAAMADAFPELTRIRGHYYCPLWGERSHWWLIDASGNIVDPTVAQFPSKGTGEYVPWEEGAPEPTGKCPNCGGLCFNGDFCCSDNCHRAYVAFCSRGFVEP